MTLHWVTLVWNGASNLTKSWGFPTLFLSSNLTSAKLGGQKQPFVTPTESVSGLGKKTMTTQHNSNNAKVMAKAMNGNGDSKSRGGGSGVRQRQPQRWQPKEQWQW
jgi:hypothetical protein